MGPRSLVHIAIATVTAVCLTHAQSRSAADVLGEVRAALGGAPALEAIRAFTVNGSQSTTLSTVTKSYQYQAHFLLPDYYMHIRHDMMSAPMLTVDITYWNGFAVDDRIYRVDSSLPFPPDPPRTPASEQAAVRRHKREFARFALALFGASFPSYPLAFTLAPQETVDGRPMDVVDGAHADGFAVRLYVDASTHRPAIVAWQDRQRPVAATSTSRVVAANGRVVSEGPPPVMPPIPDESALPIITRKTVLSDYKTEGGLTWPRRFRTMVGQKLEDDVRWSRVKINPSLSPKAFDVGRD